MRDVVIWCVMAWCVFGAMAVREVVLAQTEEAKNDEAPAQTGMLLNKSELPSLTAGGFSDWSNLAPVLVLSSPEPIMEIKGVLSENDYSTTEGQRSWTWPRYKRPEKPENVKVTLYTADGRKWIVRWEEVKEFPANSGN